MKQLTQSEFKKNGKIYKNISSPATSGTQTQVTDLVYDGGVLKLSTDGGSTFVDVTTAQETQIDDTTITKNTDNKLQAVGLKTNTTILTAEQIYLACSIEREV